MVKRFMAFVLTVSLLTVFSGCELIDAVMAEPTAAPVYTPGQASEQTAPPAEAPARTDAPAPEQTPPQAPATAPPAETPTEAPAQPPIVGRWRMVSSDDPELFETFTQYGGCFYSFDAEGVLLIEFATPGLSDEAREQALEYFADFTELRRTYRVLSDSELELTGIAGSATAKYSLSGNTLAFEGAEFARAE